MGQLDALLLALGDLKGKDATTQCHMVYTSRSHNTGHMSMALTLPSSDVTVHKAWQQADDHTPLQHWQHRQCKHRIPSEASTFFQPPEESEGAGGGTVPGRDTEGAKKEDLLSRRSRIVRRLP